MQQEVINTLFSGDAAFLFLFENTDKMRFFISSLGYNLWQLLI